VTKEQEHARTSRPAGCDDDRGGVYLAGSGVQSLRNGGAGIIRVVVQNHNFHQATVKALGRIQRRIGIVAGNSSETFSLPWPTADNLVLEIDLLAGSTFRTNSISLEPGESATLYIEQVISLSTLVRAVGSDGG